MNEPTTISKLLNGEEAQKQILETKKKLDEELEKEAQVEISKLEKEPQVETPEIEEEPQEEVIETKKEVEKELLIQSQKTPKEIFKQWKKDSRRVSKQSYGKSIKIINRYWNWLKNILAFFGLVSIFLIISFFQLKSLLSSINIPM